MGVLLQTELLAHFAHFLSPASSWIKQYCKSAPQGPGHSLLLANKHLVFMYAGLTVKLVRLAEPVTKWELLRPTSAVGGYSTAQLARPHPAVPYEDSCNLCWSAEELRSPSSKHTLAIAFMSSVTLSTPGR